MLPEWKVTSCWMRASLRGPVPDRMTCVHHVRTFIHSLIHSFIHSFIRSCLHSFMPSCLHSFIRSLTHSLTHSLTLSFTHSFIENADKHMCHVDGRRASHTHQVRHPHGLCSGCQHPEGMGTTETTVPACLSTKFPVVRNIGFVVMATDTTGYE